MWTVLTDGFRGSCSVILMFVLLTMIQPETAAPSRPVSSERDRSALQSFCHTFSGWEGLCGPLRRAKRSADVIWVDILANSKMTLPDTKWCGSGNSASSYDDLGRAAATDRCCRTHDHCPLWLAAGEARSGANNTGSYTRSACACDKKFFDCLVEANTAHSQLVGEMYFNILHPRCIQNITTRHSRQMGPGPDQQQPEEQLRLVESPLAGQYPKQPNDKEMMDDVQNLAVTAYRALVNGR